MKTTARKTAASVTIRLPALKTGEHYAGLIVTAGKPSHHVILLGLAKHWPQLSWIWLTLAGAALTLAVAEPMRRWVEEPCARLRKRLHRKTLAREPAPGVLPVGAP